MYCFHFDIFTFFTGSKEVINGFVLFFMVLGLSFLAFFPFEMIMKIKLSCQI